MATKAKIKKERPLLSVGIIFKNEIRCLERCLKSIQPLRERLSVELVMADTGSTDGSRAVAARYADILFDFPWVDDFAAAPLPLLAAIVRIESAFLAPLHRFTLHLANAFAVLLPTAVSPAFTPTVSGGMRDALAELKAAVIAAPEQKPVVDKVLDTISEGSL